MTILTLQIRSGKKITPKSQSHFPHQTFSNVSTKPSYPVWGRRDNLNARVAGPHRLSLEVTRGGEGAKKLAPPGHPELSHIMRRGSPSETPFLWSGLPSQTYVQSKEQSQMEVKSFLLRP